MIIPDPDGTFLKGVAQSLDARRKAIRFAAGGKSKAISLEIVREFYQSSSYEALEFKYRNVHGNPSVVLKVYEDRWVVLRVWNDRDHFMDFKWNEEGRIFPDRTSEVPELLIFAIRESRHPTQNSSSNLETIWVNIAASGPRKIA